MPETKIQDAVTYNPQPLKVLRDETSIKLLEDENLRMILRLLRKHKDPMTVKELEAAFKKEGDAKSDKTIYRYLNKLEKGKLVVQAGKRMLTDENNKIRTQTLYARTAKIFLPDYGDDKKKHLAPEEQKFQQQISKAVTILIRNRYGYSQTAGSEDCINMLLEKVFQRQGQLNVELLESSTEDLDEIFGDIDIKKINEILTVAVLLAFLHDENNWQKELRNCYSD